MIYEDFKTEVITLDEYKIFKADCDQKISDANQSITRLIGNRNKVNSGLTGQQNWLSQFREYQNIQELNRRVVIHFIERIEVTAEKQVQITLNHADQFRAILDFLKEYQKQHHTKQLLSEEVG